ncbi:MAG: SMC-Scp complex subunit ScpB, partial [Actinomycetota bacterium]|nr:SMC-Scp complex subunit ScpB [Actinomycetota bacterium]
MSGPGVRKAVEAVLLVVDEPVAVRTLAAVLGAPAREVASTLSDLRAQYAADDRGFVLREVAGGWRLYTHPDAADVVERFVTHGRSGRLSQAALETLAIIAYKQPVTRGEVAEIRGVDADAGVRSLVGRGLVAEIGRRAAPGQPLEYATTPAFLERLGLRGLDELPPLPRVDDALPPEPPPGGYRQARRD